MNPWVRLRGASPLVVYVDLKSPYAYIAIEPIRAVARAAGVAVEWRPFMLDIPSYLGSARLDRDGRVVENRRSPAQWGGVRYAYRDARRYARLGGQVLRGTEKIWDSSLFGIGLLWAARQSAAIVDRYLDDCYARFWRRALDIESAAVIAAQLRAAGASVAGFAEFADGPGRAELARSNAEAFAAGIFGVPSFLVADEFWFGREHLPRVAWLLGGRVGAAPLPAYRMPDAVGLRDAGLAPARRGPDGRPQLRVAVDLRDPHVLLAWKPTLALARECDAVIDWVPFAVGAPKSPPAPRAEEDRGTAHRRYRAEQQAREVDCYARAAGLVFAAHNRELDVDAAHLGLLWARQAGPQQAEVWLAAALAADRVGSLASGDLDAVATALERAGIPADGFVAWATTLGKDTLAAERAELQSCGVSRVPTYLVGDEPYQGMAHLPLLRALLLDDKPR